MGTFKLGKMTLRSVFKKPDTILYPMQIPSPHKGERGHVEIDIDACILCGICQKRCPADAIVVDKASSVWTIDDFRCVQCECCVRECPKVCLKMLPELSAASTVKSNRVVAKSSAEEKQQP